LSLTKVALNCTLVSVGLVLSCSVSFRRSKLWTISLLLRFRCQVAK